jgi:tetratricopeptide (TPR) repeat protein
MGVVAMAVVSLAAQTPALPPLPDVPLASFSEDARDGIDTAMQAAKAKPNDAMAVGGLGITLQAWEQWDASHQAYRRAQALAPAAADWWYLDGLVLQRLVRHGEAADAFARALALAPSMLPARARLAEARFDHGDLAGSREVYTALASEPAAAPVGEFGLGRIAAAEGRHAEAIAHFQRATALFPEFGAAYYALAQSLRASGRRPEAVTALEHHRTFGTRWPAIPDPVGARVGQVRDDPRGHLFRGLRLAEQGDLPGAIEAHEAVLARNPSLAQAHANLISLYGRVGKYADAERHYRAMLAIGLNLDEAHYNYGVLLGLQERWTEAETALRQALAANPHHAQARNNLGQLLEAARKVPEAREQYARAVAADPNLRVARYNLARMLLAQRQLDAAIAELEKLREPADAESPRYLYALAVAHVQSGRRDTGVALAREARARAARFGQGELVTAIDRDLAQLQ